MAAFSDLKGVHPSVVPVFLCPAVHLSLGLGALVHLGTLLEQDERGVMVTVDAVGSIPLS